MKFNSVFLLFLQRICINCFIAVAFILLLPCKGTIIFINFKLRHNKIILKYVDLDFF